MFFITFLLINNWLPDSSYLLNYLPEGYKFIHPDFVVLFYTIPVFWLLAIFGLKKLAIWRIALSIIFRSIVLSAIVLALAGLSRVEEGVKDINVVYLADVSDSVKKNGKSWIKEYIDDMESKLDDSITRELNIFAMNSQQVLQAEDNSNITNFNFDETFINLNPERTNIESAIISSLGKFPEDSIKRLILLSDGNENVGDVTKAAILAKNENVEIYTVSPPKSAYENSITIKKVLIPSEIPAGKTAELKIVIDNKKDTVINGDVKLMLHDSEKPGSSILFKRWNGEFLPGLTVYKTKYRPAKKGFVRFETILEAEKDIKIEKGSIVNPLIITGKSKVLYVNGIKGRKIFLPETLEERNIEVEIMNTENFPETILDLLSYESIIFSGVPVSTLNQEQMEMIEQYVKDFGGGFVMLGGQNSFIQGGYAKTPIEKILPVKMVGGEHKREKKKTRLSLVMVIDKSGSMSGKKMTFAKKAAIELVNQLKPDDNLGIIAFDNNPFIVADLRPVLAVQLNLVQKLSKLYPGGGTNIFPALKLAYMRIVQSKTASNTNHVTLLSDGNTEYLYYNKEALIKSYKNAKISISTIAIGKWFVNTNLLKDIASRTGGRFYKIDDVSELPKLIVKDVNDSIVHTDIHEEFFYPTKVGNSKILKDISQKQLPPLKGFSITTAKESAKTPLITDIRGKTDPILANWRYGLGKTIAYMADAEARWSADWVKWMKYNKFWSQALRWAMKDIPESEYTVKVKYVDNKPYLFIESFHKDELYNTNKHGTNKENEQTELKVRLYKSQNQQKNNLNQAKQSGKYDELQLRQIGPRSYISPIESYEPGNYFTNVLFTRNEKVLSSKTKGLVIPQFKTIKPYDTGKHHNNVEVLKEISAITGGKYEPKVSDIVGNFEKIFKYISLIKYLIPIALGALIFDIALRKR